LTGVFLALSGISMLCGSVSAAVVMMARSSPAQIASSLGCSHIWDGTGLGFLFGCFFIYGSKVGWYHKVFLPVILIELAEGDTSGGSTWGAVDECALVLVSAGICAANLACPPPLATAGDVAMSRRGLATNLLYGDFIEAAYPFMERSAVVNACAYAAGGLATEIVYRSPNAVRSSAYLLIPAAVWFAGDRV